MATTRPPDKLDGPDMSSPQPDAFRRPDAPQRADAGAPPHRGQQPVSSVPTLILRDPRESLKKCSLTPLRGREDVRFVDYAPSRRLEVGGRVLLHPEGEVLGPADRGQPLLVVDSSWRRLPALLATLDGDPVRRRLPSLVTAYPRRSKTFPDPGQGLASIEALYAALFLMGRPDRSLLDGYHWAEDFLNANPAYR